MCIGCACMCLRRSQSGTDSGSSEWGGAALPLLCHAVISSLWWPAVQRRSGAPDRHSGTQRQVHDPDIHHLENVVYDVLCIWNDWLINVFSDSCMLPCRCFGTNPSACCRKVMKNSVQYMSNVVNSPLQVAVVIVFHPLPRRLCELQIGSEGKEKVRANYAHH